MGKKQISEPATTGETVTVACNLPNGLILRVFDMVNVRRARPGGGFDEEPEARLAGEPFTLHGNRTSFGEEPKCKVVCGYALTRGVPKDLWDRWLEQNEDSDLVRNNLIHAHESMDEAADASEELDGTKSGLQPLNPGDDSRMPRRVTTADEQPKPRATA